MTRIHAGAVLLVWAASSTYGQGAEAKPQFDVATVKPAASQPMGMMRVGSSGGPGTKDPGRYTATNMSLANLLMQAYDIKRFQLTGPNFLDSERFDVTAKVPEGASKEQFRLMLQGLLEERFKMAVHKEKKDGQVYELIQAKGGHKLKEYVEDPAAIAAAREGGPNAPPLPPPPPPGSPGFQMGKDGFPAFPKGAPGRGPMMIMMNGKAKMQAEGITMDQLVNMLSNQVGKPVVDATNLKGKYDMTLFYSPEGLGGGPGGGRMMVAVGPPGVHDGPAGAGGPAPAPADGEVGPTLFAALQEQLGLKLDQKKGTVDLIVVDRMEKVPTEN